MCLQARAALEEERRALAAFVRTFDALGLGLGTCAPAPLHVPRPVAGGAPAAFAERQQNRGTGRTQGSIAEEAEGSPLRVLLDGPSLLEQMPEEEWSVVEDVSFEMEVVRGKGAGMGKGVVRGGAGKEAGKENVPV